MSEEQRTVPPQWTLLAFQLDKVAEAVQEYVHRPWAPGCLAELDRAAESEYSGFPFDHPMTEVTLQPLHYLGSAEDHLTALAGVLRTPGTILASMTVLRTVLVGAAYARYLADPAVDTRERFRRGMNVQLETLTERMRMVGRHESTWHADNKTRRKIVGAARQAGWSATAPSVDAAWPREWFILPKPLGEGKLIDALLSDAGDGRNLGQFFYRLMSAVTHAQQHGLLALIDRQSAVSRGDGISAVSVKMDLPTLQLLAIAAVGGLTMTMDALVSYYGWSPAVWQVKGSPVFHDLRRQLGLPIQQ